MEVIPSLPRRVKNELRRRRIRRKIAELRAGVQKNRKRIRRLREKL